MPLIIEDGTIVEGANSYATVEQARDFAATRGYILAPDDTEGNARIETMLAKACDYLNSRENDYVGYRVQNYVQPLSWPRRGVRIYDEVWPDNKIPSLLVDAQCQLCIEVSTQIVLFHSTAGGLPIIRDKTGPLETQFSEAVLLAGIDLGPKMPAVDMWLGPLMAPRSRGLTTRRV